MTRCELVSGLAATTALAGARPGPASGEPPPETTRIRLVQTPSMCQAPQYVAEELLKAEGFTEVQYVRKEGPYDIADALASGEVDINLHFSARLVVRLDHGDPIVILAGVHPGCFELFTARPLRSLTELKGKRVAVTHPTARSMELLREGKIDAFLGFPPDPQELRGRKVGHVLVDSSVDRPWSQYFCCMVAAHRDFVRKHPVATKRALRAILKGTDVCAVEPERAAQMPVDSGRTRRYDLMRQVLKEIPYNRWRDYNPEATVRFYALRLHQAGMVKATPQKLIAQGTDWRLLDDLRKELKG
jgi:NitT/TauT family transport system substrate-binding protein